MGHIEWDSRDFFGLTSATLEFASLGKAKSNADKSREALRDRSATTSRSASTNVLMLKVGPIASIPGKSRPGMPISKTLRDGVFKLPWALAETVKAASAFPLKPPVKAC